MFNRDKANKGAAQLPDRLARSVKATRNSTNKALPDINAATAKTSDRLARSINAAAKNRRSDS